MIFQIPEGRKVKAKSNEVFVTGKEGTYAYLKQIDSFPKTAGTSSKDYVLVQQGNQVYAMSMKQRFGGFTHQDAHVEVLKSGSFVPTPSLFMPHYVRVNEAQQGKGVLYDASGALIEGNRLDNYANTLNHGSWVWLNASFRKGEGFNGLEIVTINGLDKEGNPVIESTPLKDCLGESCYADLEYLNSQGFPTKKSPVQKYEPGKNVYFGVPTKDLAVRFFSAPGGAGLGCDWDPLTSYSWLGVFDCAEGVAKNSK